MNCSTNIPNNMHLLVLIQRHKNECTLTTGILTMSTGMGVQWVWAYNGYFSNDFDSISRARIELILSIYSIPQKIIKAIISMYSHTSTTVITPDGQSDPFDITASVMQGDTLSLFLFVVVVDYNTKFLSLMLASDENEEKDPGHLLATLQILTMLKRKSHQYTLSFYRTSSTPDASTSYDSVLWFLAAL